MKDIYEGKAIWLGPDETGSSLAHGKPYFITVKQMNNGKMRVDLDSDIYIGVSHMTFKSKDEFQKFFYLKPEKRRKS